MGTCIIIDDVPSLVDPPGPYYGLEPQAASKRIYQKSRILEREISDWRDGKFWWAGRLNILRVRINR